VGVTAIAERDKALKWRLSFAPSSQEDGQVIKFIALVLLPHSRGSCCAVLQGARSLRAAGDVCIHDTVALQSCWSSYL
jgi:hypothetical protein